MIKTILLLLISFNIYAQPITCGLQGSIQERIADCSELYEKSLSKRGDTQLVAVSEKNYFTYYHQERNVLWSDRLEFRYPYDEAVEVCQNYGTNELKVKNVKWSLPSVDDFNSFNSRISDHLPTFQRYVFYWVVSNNSDTTWGRSLFDSYFEVFYKDTYIFNTYSVRCIGVVNE